MSWRRGELWLDAGGGGVRERAAAVAGFAPAPLPSFGPPPGLAASRQRRIDWKRRRESRRARVTAVALSPAVVLALAGLRSGGEPGTLAAEDPPSLTFRVTGETVGAVEIPRHV